MALCQSFVELLLCFQQLDDVELRCSLRSLILCQISSIKHEIDSCGHFRVYNRLPRWPFRNPCNVDDASTSQHASRTKKNSRVNNSRKSPKNHTERARKRGTQTSRSLARPWNSLQKRQRRRRRAALRRSTPARGGTTSCSSPLTDSSGSSCSGYKK